MQQVEHTLLPAEWFPQSAVQLTWPHAGTDWAPILDEVIPCFVSIAKEIMKREKLVVVCPDTLEVKEQLGVFDEERVRFVELPTNDTWARDHGGISVFDPLGMMVYDFVFNGWGMKFAANKDNLITRNLYQAGVFAEEIQLVNMAPFILEGGSIESDGQGTLMATAECLLSVNRNEYLQREEIEHYLKDVFGVKRILWIENGYLAGDDTDSHVDTLARFCSEDTIAYVKCEDESDEHYDELLAMEEEIKAFRQENGDPYRLISLPMADEIVWEGERLPATYANFLIMNGAVLLPFYNSPKDEQARKALQMAFPDREVVGINCLPLIKQHGSLHCVTMQYPEGYVR
ncbi:MAG TPA: agmatine deiminase family protein [Candidatus Parabacteroides intestinavium]|nr:agmatine deiminase family protein [Candidatus Parabacteroides intestinavium]